MEIILSHRLELLKDHLMDDFFSHSLFCSKVLIVPSYAIKDWLMMEFAKEKGIALGFKVMFLEEAVRFFLQNKEAVFFPTKFDLEFYLQEELLNVSDKESSNKPLIDFLSEDRSKMERLLQLSSSLAELFHLYGIYGLQLTKELENAKNWQALLWQKIFSKKGFTFPLSHLPLQGLISKAEHTQIYLFGFSYIPAVYFSFLEELSKSYSMIQYLFSPCAQYWGDLISKDEKKAVKARISQANQEKYRDYFAEVNPLLENWGVLARRYQKIITEFDCQEKEDYEDKENEDTLLEKLKRELLNLHTPNKEEVVEDTSIQVHKHVGSRLREVEDLYDQLQKIIYFSKETIEPSDILILSPDINLYAPFIHMVFGGTDSVFDYSISDLSVASKSFFSSGAMKLLNLYNGKWELDEVFQVFQNPLFKKKFNFSDLEIEKIYHWFTQAHVTWGYDKKHRNSLMGEALDSMGSFTFAIERMIMGMTVHLNDLEQESQYQFCYPLSNIDITDANLIARLIDVLRSLWEDLSILKAKKSWHGKDWAEFLEKLMEKYFFFSEDLNGVVEKMAWSNFQDFLTRLKNLSTHLRQPICFERILFSFSKHMRKKTFSFQKNKTDAVCFRSLKSSNLYPAKIVFLIGMEEDNFFDPTKNSMNLLKEYHPTYLHKQRYCFLQALFTAKNYLCISYRSFCFESAKEIAPSLLVQEFLSYLDQFYHVNKQPISEKITRAHSPFSFDPEIFEKGISFSNKKASAALAFTKEKKITSFTRFARPATLFPREKDAIIPLRKLNLLAYNPFQFFLNESCGLFLEEQLDEELLFSNLQEAILLSSSFSHDLEALLFSYEKQSKLPLGIFNTIAKKTVKEKAAQFQRHLANWEIAKKDVVVWEFSSECSEPVFGEDKWIFPAPKITYKGGFAYIVGQIKNVTSQGLLLIKEGNFLDLVSNRPKYLMYLHGAKLLNKGQAQLFFLKSGRKKALLEKDHLTFLSRYVEYYFSSSVEMSPLIYPWASFLLRDDLKGFEKNVRASFQGQARISNIYHDWVFANIQMFDAKRVFSDWAPYLQHVFQPVIHEK